QMDTVVQMNASLVEEATAAATSMANQAQGLARSVAQFRIAESAHGPTATIAGAAGAPALSRRAAHDRQPPTLTERREPMLAAATEEEEWKEF
ncbi:MAG TPA: chemotaxis protein, partial [Usitatibacter sp.]|nr:chemotaxis protein [Usitatibacter sp.]